MKYLLAITLFSFSFTSISQQQSINFYDWYVSNANNGLDLSVEDAYVRKAKLDIKSKFKCTIGNTVEEYVYLTTNNAYSAAATNACYSAIVGHVNTNLGCGGTASPHSMSGVDKANGVITHVLVSFSWGPNCDMPSSNLTQFSTIYEGTDEQCDCPTKTNGGTFNSRKDINNDGFTCSNDDICFDSQHFIESAFDYNATSVDKLYPKNIGDPQNTCKDSGQGFPVGMTTVNLGGESFYTPDKDYTAFCMDSGVNGDQFTPAPSTECQAYGGSTLCPAPDECLNGGYCPSGCGEFSSGIGQDAVFGCITNESNVISSCFFTGECSGEQADPTKPQSNYNAQPDTKTNNNYQDPNVNRTPTMQEAIQNYKDSIENMRGNVSTKCVDINGDPVQCPTSYLDTSTDSNGNTTTTGDFTGIESRLDGIAQRIDGVNLTLESGFTGVNENITDLNDSVKNLTTTYDPDYDKSQINEKFAQHKSDYEEEFKKINGDENAKKITDEAGQIFGFNSFENLSNLQVNACNNPSISLPQSIGGETHELDMCAKAPIAKEFLYWLLPIITAMTILFRIREVI